MGNTIEYWRERAQKNGAEVLRLRAQRKELEAQLTASREFALSLWADENELFEPAYRESIDA
jgi:hypothetical protein